MWDGIKEIFKLLKVGKRKKKWHKLHPNSDTTPMNDFDFEHVLIGKGTYGELNVVDFGGNAKLIIINYVSIAQHVSFILNAEHYTDHISTYPFKVKILRTQNTESFSKGNIIVDDDVWVPAFLRLLQQGEEPCGTGQGVLQFGHHTGYFIKRLGVLVRVA